MSVRLKIVNNLFKYCHPEFRSPAGAREGSGAGLYNRTLMIANRKSEIGSRSSEFVNRTYFLNRKSKIFNPLTRISGLRPPIINRKFF